MMQTLAGPRLLVRAQSSVRMRAWGSLPGCPSVLTCAQPQAALSSACLRVPALGLESLDSSGPQPHCICRASGRSSAGPLPLHPGPWLVSGPHPISAASGESYRNPARTVAEVPGRLHTCWPTSLRGLCRALLPNTDPDSLVLRQFTHCLLAHLLYSSPNPKEGIGPTLNTTT